MVFRRQLMLTSISGLRADRVKQSSNHYLMAFVRLKNKYIIRINADCVSNPQSKNKLQLTRFITVVISTKSILSSSCLWESHYDNCVRNITHAICADTCISNNTHAICADAKLKILLSDKVQLYGLALVLEDFSKAREINYDIHSQKVK